MGIRKKGPGAEGIAHGGKDRTQKSEKVGSLEGKKAGRNWHNAEGIAYGCRYRMWEGGEVGRQEDERLAAIEENGPWR